MCVQAAVGRPPWDGPRGTVFRVTEHINTITHKHLPPS